MARHILSFACLLAFVLSLSACDLFGGEERVERTYPDAFDFELVNVEEVLENVQEIGTKNLPAPGRYNLDVYVHYVTICPADARCYIPDNIGVSSRPPLPFQRRIEGIYYLSANYANDDFRQFRAGRRYLLSVEVSVEDGHINPLTGELIRYIRLLGYDLIG